MNSLSRIRRTSGAKWILAPRLIAGLPLAGIGTLHLVGDTPMRAILEAARIPLPGLNAVLAPVLMIAGGLSLLSGFYARIGGVLGAGAMLVALYSHFAIEQWPGPTEPPLALPLGVLLASAIVVVVGAGAWSLDRRALSSP